MLTIAVVNQKGGVAKTTTSMNLAVGLARSGFRVLAMDLDAQAHLTVGLGVDSTQMPAEETVASLFYDEKALPLLIVDTPEKGLKLVPSSIHLALAVENLYSVIFRETKLRKSLSLITDQFDYVVMDCAPNLSVLSINALVAADRILVPTKLSTYSLSGLSDLLSTIRQVKHDGEHYDLRILLTMLKGSAKERQEAAWKLLAPVRSSILNTQIRETEAVEKSQITTDDDTRVMAVVTERPSANRGSQDYWSLVKEIIELWPANPKD